MKKAMKKLAASRFANNWSWWDTVTGFLFGGTLGSLVTLYFINHQSYAKVIGVWGMPIVQVTLALFLLGRMIAVARWPRTTPLDYNKITWAGVAAANFVTIIMGLAFLATVLSLVVPGLLQLLAKQL